MGFWDSLDGGLQKVGQYINPLTAGQKLIQGANTGLNDAGLQPLAQVTTAPTAAVLKGGNQIVGGALREAGYLTGQVPGVGNALGNVVNSATNTVGYQSMPQMRQQNVSNYNQNVMQPLAGALGNGAPVSVGSPAGSPQTSPSSPPPAPVASGNAAPIAPQPNGMGQQSGPMQAASNWNPMAYGQKPQGLNQLQNGIQAPYIPPIQS